MTIDPDQKAAVKRFEALVDKRAKKCAKQMSGHVRFFGTERSKAIVAAFNEVMEQQRRRKLN